MPLRLASLLIGLSGLLAGGCLGDAERGNPLDPLSDNFRDAGAVAGIVTTVYAPFDGLPDARVRIAPLGGGSEQIAQTDGAGRFTLPTVSSGTYEVTAEIEGYASVSDTVGVTLGQLIELTLRLDGIPVPTVRMLYTERLDRWFPQEPLFQLVVEATVSDPDGLGDIEEVRLVAPMLGFADTLREVAGEPGVYRRVFAESELPVPAQDLLGQPLRVEATDRLGVHGLTRDAQIVRIIDVFPNGIAPAPGPGGLPTVGPQPTFEWRAVVAPFSFTYRVDLTAVPVPGQEIPFQSYAGIPSSATTFTAPDALPPGDYAWTVSAIDAFGNRSRSRPLGFRVGG